MRKATFAFLFVLSQAAVACSFQMGASTKKPTTPTATPADPAAAQPAAATPAAPTRGEPRVVSVGKRVPGGGTSPATPATPANPTTPTTPAGIPVLAGTNVFGSGTADATGWKGTFFVIPPASQKLPAIASLTPAGVLFAKELNVAQKAMTGGFPGIDATRNENFAIRWEAPLVVENEADYTFRLVSDDGSILQIDNTPIVDNDGARDSAKEKSGPVHLVKGTHVITVDYFQATGPVALQLFCKKAGGNETICPTKL